MANNFSNLMRKNINTLTRKTEKILSSINSETHIKTSSSNSLQPKTTRES